MSELAVTPFITEKPLQGLPERLQVVLPWPVPDSTRNLICTLQGVVLKSSATHIDLQTGLPVKSPENEELWDLLCNMTDEVNCTPAEQTRYRMLYEQATRTSKKNRILMDLTTAALLLQFLRAVIQSQKWTGEAKERFFQRSVEGLIAAYLSVKG